MRSTYPSSSANQVAAASKHRTWSSYLEEGPFVNGAQVTTADVYASNGVIHIIDGVLLPQGEPAMSGR